MTQTTTDALRLVPRRAVYDWLRDDVPLNVKMTVMPHHIDALMDRLSKAAPASPLPGGGWQDISTAPKKHGVQILMFDGRRVFAGEWGLGRYDRSLRQYEHTWTAGVHLIVHPTHWMPLPAAPTGDA